jgi:predicted MFS family arabinose efflux permease
VGPDSNKSLLRSIARDVSIVVEQDLMQLPKSRLPVVGLLAQSALARLAVQMAAVVYGWGMLKETGSSFSASLIMAASLAALIFGTMFAGRLIARFGAHQIALTGTWLSCVAAFAIAILFSCGLASPYVIAVIAALGMILDGPAAVATETNYPEIARIGGVNLTRLNALDDALDNSATLVAPAAGAALIAGTSVSVALYALALLGALTALILTFALPRFRIPHHASAAGISKAFHFIRTDRLLFPMTVLLCSMLAIFWALELVILPRAISEAGNGPGTLAASLFAAGVGGLSGAVLSGILANKIRIATLVPLAFAMLAASAALLLLLPAIAPLIASGYLMGLASGLIMAPVTTLYQTRPPKFLRADVQSLSAALVLSATPAALLTSGILIDLVQPSTLVWCVVAGVVLTAAGSWIWLSRVE